MCSSREASWLSVGKGDWFVILSSRSQKLGAWPFCRHAQTERDWPTTTMSRAAQSHRPLQK